MRLWGSVSVLVMYVCSIWRWFFFMVTFFYYHSCRFFEILQLALYLQFHIIFISRERGGGRDSIYIYRERERERERERRLHPEVSDIPNIHHTVWVGGCVGGRYITLRCWSYIYTLQRRFGGSGGFFLACDNFVGSSDDSFPACAFFFHIYFFCEDKLAHTNSTF